MSIKGHRKTKRTNVQLLLPVLCLCALFIFFQIRWVERNRDKFIDEATISYVQQFNPNVKLRILCPACAGTGEFQTETESIPCPLSFGLGFLELAIDPDKQAICHNCGGMGALLDVESMIPHPCEVCDSTGVLESINPYSRMQGPIRTFIFECHHCNAQGQLYDAGLGEKIQCPICLGKGERETRAVAGIEDGCGNCGGMGRWMDPDTEKAEICPRCQGHGLVQATQPEEE